MITIQLTQEEYNLLIRELLDGEAGRHNDDNVHSDDVGSKVLTTIDTQGHPQLIKLEALESSRKDFKQYVQEIKPLSLREPDGVMAKAYANIISGGHQT